MSETLLNKNVVVQLKSSFRYEGLCIEHQESFIRVNDRKVGMVFIPFSSIDVVREV